MSLTGSHLIVDRKYGNVDLYVITRHKFTVKYSDKNPKTRN